MRWLLAVLLVALFAGCTDAPEDGGDTGDSMGSEPSEPTYETVTVTDVLQTEVDWEGETDEGAWVCGVPTCPGGHAPTADNSYVHTVTFAGELSHLTLDLDWTPADATQFTGLEIQIVGTQSQALVGFWSGTSSFTIDADVQAPGDDSITILVWPANKDGGATYVDATAQPFTLSGIVFGEVEREEQREVTA